MLSTGTYTPNTVGIVSTSSSASIASTTIYTVPATSAGVRGGAGMYVVFVDVICTQAGTAGSVTVGVTWTNSVNSSPELDSVAFSLTSVGEQSALLGNFMAAENSVISYYTTVTGASGAPSYTLNLRLQFLG